MNKFSSSLMLANQQVELGKSLGVIQLSTTDEELNGRTIKIGDQELLNFGSCSYLGLELDPRLRSAALEGIARYGVQFSSSRSYVSLGLYEELEGLFAKIFGRPTIVAPSTTMGHFSAIPVLITAEDAIIMDNQVHASIQNAVKLVKAKGTRIEKAPHNDMEHLEKRIAKLSEKYNAVWYMADGIYSMYGDLAPIDYLESLLDKFPKLHLYLDDAHGVGWYGKNGRGYVLEHMKFHPRLILTASTSKSFGAGGGVIVFPNEEIKRLVRNTGGTLMFSGPLQPPSLAACIASAKLHLSKDIIPLQEELHDKLNYFVQLCRELQLPLASDSKTPVFYIGGGSPETGTILCRKMMNRGYYTNLAGFPAVPYDNTGLRITVTNHISKADIKNLLFTLAKELKITTKENNYPVEKIFTAFGLPIPEKEGEKKRVA